MDGFAWGLSSNTSMSIQAKTLCDPLPWELDGLSLAYKDGQCPRGNFFGAGWAGETSFIRLNQGQLIVHGASSCQD